ncbi:MAG: nicotinate-nucleotide--dimethylbenzimidazole phosphoribosyltransferase [Chloroflexi bacterium]|nr:MAG: nicotinate-nucleotide--dimethylbenzimidazole phosphoribosyltransferase [Chloroflexota bacterium]
MQTLFERAASIAPLDTDALDLARTHQQELTKPAGSLGRLEDIAVHIAGVTGQPFPKLAQKAVIIMGAKVIAVDVGVATEITHPDLLSRKVAFGTANMVLEPAMTRAQMLEAIQVGMDVCDALLDQGVDLVATGDMGIGNTTASSAITAALLQTPVALVTGRGTGIDDEQLAHKIQVIEQALARHAPNPGDPLDVLMKVGGLEIAGLVGVIVAAASRRVPIVIDGFISGAAALVAVELNPLIREYLLAGHASVERGHRLILDRLGLSPLLDLKLRLGEGTGAVLAMSIIEAALHAHCEMATFEEAGVSTREEK